MIDFININHHYCIFHGCILSFDAQGLLLGPDLLSKIYISKILFSNISVNQFIHGEPAI